MIRLAKPPSTNSLYRNRRGGRAKTKVYSAWLEAASWQVKVQKPKRVEGKCAVTIRVEKRGRVKEDIDNRIKSVLDLLVATDVIEDDRNVWRVTAEWADVSGCEVEVKPYD